MRRIRCTAAQALRRAASRIDPPPSRTVTIHLAGDIAEFCQKMNHLHLGECDD